MIAYVILALFAFAHYTFFYCDKHRMVNPVVGLFVFWLWPAYATYLVYKWGRGRL